MPRWNGVVDDAYRHGHGKQRQDAAEHTHVARGGLVEIDHGTGLVKHRVDQRGGLHCSPEGTHGLRVDLQHSISHTLTITRQGIHGIQVHVEQFAKQGVRDVNHLHLGMHLVP